MKTTWLRKGISFLFSSSGLATAILLTAAFGHRPSPGHYNSTPTQRARVIEALAKTCNSCGCLNKMMNYIQDKASVPAYDGFVFGRCGVPPVEGAWGEKSAYDAYGQGYFFGYDQKGNYFTYPTPTETERNPVQLPGTDAYRPRYMRDAFGYYTYKDCWTVNAEHEVYRSWAYTGSGRSRRFSSIAFAPYSRKLTLENLEKFFNRANKRDLCKADAKIKETLQYLQARLDITSSYHRYRSEFSSPPLPVTPAPDKTHGSRD